MKTDSVRIATEYFWNKPPDAFFAAFEIEEYARARVKFKRPLLDLGCDDGTFAETLQERGIIDSVDLALDYSIKNPLEVKNTVYGIIQGDARALPLKSDTLASVIANGVLESVESDVNTAIFEVYRVLVEQGLFVLTVPTSRFNQNLLIPKILNKIGASQLIKRYLEWLDCRLLHYQVFDEKIWLKRLKDANFHIDQVRYYFTPYQACWWNFFTFYPSWVKRLKIIKNILGRTKIARIQERVFRWVLAKEPSLIHNREQAGYLLIVARKIPIGAD